MRTMPLKPLKRVLVERQARDRYKLTIKSRIDNEAAFHDIVRRDFVACLVGKDSLVAPDWESRSLTVVTRDFVGFKQRLIFRLYLVRDEQ